MLNHIYPENILFIDIETVPQHPEYKNLDTETKELWDKKANFLKKEETDTAELLYGRAGIYAEFGKIICISAGYIKHNEFRVKSFYGDDEKIVLQEFAELCNRYFNSHEHLLCGHNAKEFDFPYICRRSIINGVEIPEMLDIAGKKPWEIKHLDTMELWKFGDFKSFTSLKLLAHIFGIPSPKEDIDGSEVAGVYYKDNDLERIARYCERDTLTVAQIFLKYQGKPIISTENIVSSLQTIGD